MCGGTPQILGAVFLFLFSSFGSVAHASVAYAKNNEIVSESHDCEPTFVDSAEAQNLRARLVDPRTRDRFQSKILLLENHGTQKDMPELNFYVGAGDLDISHRAAWARESILARAEGRAADPLIPSRVYYTSPLMGVFQQALKMSESDAREHVAKTFGIYERTLREADLFQMIHEIGPRLPALTLESVVFFAYNWRPVRLAKESIRFAAQNIRGLALTAFMQECRIQVLELLGHLWRDDSASNLTLEKMRAFSVALEVLRNSTDPQDIALVFNWDLASKGLTSGSDLMKQLKEKQEEPSPDALASARSVALIANLRLSQGVLLHFLPKSLQGSLKGALETLERSGHDADLQLAMSLRTRARASQVDAAPGHNKGLIQ